MISARNMFKIVMSDEDGTQISVCVFARQNLGENVSCDGDCRQCTIPVANAIVYVEERIESMSRIFAR